MTSYRIRLFFGVAALVAIACLGWYAYRDVGTSGAGTADGTIIINPASKTQDYTVDGKKAGTIELVPLENQLPKPIPDLSKTPRIVIQNPSMSKEAWSIILARAVELTATLKKTPSDIESWVDLGIMRKELGDYAGALESWTYATKLSPTFAVPYGNIADLYGYTLKNNIKAEESFKAAIAADPKAEYIYFHAYDFYKNVLKDMTKARAVASLGYKNNPGSKELAALAAQK